MNGSRHSILRHKLAVMFCAFLCLLSFAVGIGLYLFVPSAASVSNAEGEGTVAAPRFNYAEITPSFHAGQTECIYRGVTTAAGLKNKIEVVGKYNSQSYTLASDEYNLYRVDGSEEVLLGDNDVIVSAESSADSVTVIIVSGTARGELYIEDVQDAPAYTAIDFTVNSTLYDDYTNDTLPGILTVTATRSDGKKDNIDRDLYSVSVVFHEAQNNGNWSVTADITVTLNANAGASVPPATKAGVAAQFATIQGALVAVKSEYILSSDGSYRNGEGYNVFNAGMTRKDVLGKLDVYAVYPHGLKKLELIFNDQNGTLDGTTTREGISVSPEQYNQTGIVNITLVLTDRSRDNVSVTAPVLSLNFIERAVAKIVVDQDKVDTVLSGVHIYPYTDIKTALLENLKSAITIYYTNGESVALDDNTIWNALNFDPLSPVAQDVIDCAGKPDATYDKEINVSYNDVQETLTVKGIIYGNPAVAAELTEPTSWAQQTMHQPFDLTGLSIRLRYNGSNRTQVYAPISDFFNVNDLAETAKHIKLEQCDENDQSLAVFDKDHTAIENAQIQKDTKSVKIWFSYNGENWLEDYVEAYNFHVNPETITPVFDRTTISYSSDCTKLLLNGEETFAGLPVTVTVLTNEDAAYAAQIPAEGTEAATYDSATGTVAFLAGGQFYIRLDIRADMAEEYQFANPTDGEITRTATSYVIPVFISKGTFVVTTQYGETTWQYGETESKLPTVKGTLGGREYTLGGEEVPVRLAYFKVESSVVNWTGYEDLTYESAAARTSYNDPADSSAYKKLEVGTYRVVAVTQETDAYNASKTRQSAATTVVVTPKELSDSDLSPNPITYDRTAHAVIDNNLLNSKLVYGDIATAVFELVSGNVNYTNVGSYTPKIGFNGDTPNYTWASGSNGTIRFNIVKRTFPNFTFTLNKTQLYYGETSAPVVGSPNYDTGAGVYYTVNQVGYYAASVFNTTSGKPTGSAMTGSFNTWAAGTYYAYVGTTAKMESVDRGTVANPDDFTLPSAYVAFEIKKAEIAPITLGDGTSVTVDLGAYDGTNKEITLTGWTSNVSFGNTSLLAGGYLQAKVEYTPKVGAVQTTDPVTVTSGKISFKDAGTYVITISISNDNVQWTVADSDGSQSYTITFTATIGRATIGAKPVDGTSSKTYNGDVQEIAIEFSAGTWTSLSLAGKVSYRVTGTAGAANSAYDYQPTGSAISGKFDGVIGTRNATNAGVYNVKIKLNDTNNYQWVDGDTAEYTVKYTVNKAAIGITWDKTPIVFNDGTSRQCAPAVTAVSPSYNGELVPANLTTVIYTDAACTQIVNAGTSDEGYITVAGTYSIKVTDFTVASGEKGNYELTGSEIIYTFTVGKQKLEKPTGSAIEVTFDGSMYDFYTEAGKTVLLSDENQLGIVVAEISGKDTMRDAATYTVTVMPAGDYEWQDGTTVAVTFTFTVKPMETTVTWSVAGSYVYDGKTTEHKPTVSALTNNRDGENVTFNIAGGSINAGNCTATVTLGGTKAGNYTVTNNTQAFTVKKAVLTNPGLQQTVAFSRSTRMATITGWETSKDKVSVNSSAKDVVNADLGDWSFTGGTLTYLHAGTYTFTFTINDANKNNYCWTAADNEKFGAASVAVLTQKFVVTREQLKTPVLGASRALQLGSELPFSDIAEANRKVMEIPYELSYGTYNGDSYTVGTITPARGVTYFVRVATVNDGGKVSGTNYSVYDFEWIWDNTDTDFLNWVNNNAGASDLNGTAFNLRFVYTKTLVSVTFELFGGTGYTFGENGTVGTYALDTTGLTLNGLPEWFTYAQDGNDKASYDAVTAANPNIGVKFYLSRADAEDEKNEVTQLVNGLPWNANTYWAQISVRFVNESDLEPFSQIVPFTIAKYTLKADNILWGAETGNIYDRSEHMRTASAVASTLPKSGDATLDAVVPTLTVKAWDGSWKDKVANVLYSGSDVVAYPVYIYHDANYGNYQVGEKTLSATYRINPKAITDIAVDDQSRIYGNANPTSFTYTCADIISGDTGILQFAILDGNTAVTSSTPVGDTYEIVPSLKAANGNYVFADDILITNGKFEITARPITVTIKANQSAVYGANFDLNTAGGIYTVSVNTLVNTATDVFTLSIDGKTNTSGLDQGMYTVSLASENGNYNITFVNSNKFTVNLAKIENVNVVAYGGKYDGVAHGVLATNTATFVGTPSVQWWVSADATKPAATSSSWTALSSVQVTNAGTYKYWVKVTADNHETAVYASQVTVTITKAELTIKAHFSIYYSENKPEAENYLIGTAAVLVANAAADDSKAYEIIGLQGSDTVSSIAGLLGSFSYTTDYAKGNNANNYDITLALSLTSTNYTFKAETGALTVKPLPIKVKTHTSTDFGYTEDTSYANWVTWLNTEGSGYTVELPTPTYAGSTIESPASYNTLFTISCDAILSGNRTNDVGTYDMVMTANPAHAANYAITQTETGSVTITKATNSITGAFSVSDWTYGAASVTATNPRIAFKYAEGGSGAEQLTAKLYFIKSGTTWGSTPDKTFTLDATAAVYNNGWTYNAAVIFGAMSDFKAGSYKLVLTTAGNKNYESASAEYTFKVNRAQLAFSTDDVTVNYGEGFGATYTFNGSGYVYGENAGTINLSYSSDTDYSTTNRFVNGTYYIYAKNVQIDGRTPTINTNADTTFEIDNYIVTFKVASLTVTPRALTVTIDNHTNIYHYLAITVSAGKNVYVKQDPELISYTKTGAFYGDDEEQFTLKTDAYTFENGKYQTNDAGKYPIYAVFANEDLLSSYSITIVTESGMSYASESGEYVVQSGSGNNAAVFEITKAQILLNNVKPFWLDGETKNYYDTNSATSMYYDGREKHYEPTLETFEGETLADVTIEVEYFKNGQSLGSNAPKNVGSYTVQFTFGEHKNYEPAESSSSFTIFKRPVTVTKVSGESPNWTYTGNAYEYQIRLTHLVGEELLSGYTVTDGYTLALTNENAEENVFTYRVTNAGTYRFTIDLEGVENYEIIENNQINVNFTIAKRVLTVKAENANIEYGTPLDTPDTNRFGGFTAGYTLNTVSGSLNQDALIATEIANYGLKPQSAVTFSTTYNPGTANAGNSFAVTPAGATDALSGETTNFAIRYDSTARLTVTPRNIDVTLHGYSAKFGGNASATSPYTGRADHPATLNTLLENHIADFLSVNTDAFGQSKESVMSLDNALRALGVTLSIDQGATNVRNDTWEGIERVGYEMKPRASSTNYKITFYNTDGVALDGYDVSTVDGWTYLPNYYISPLELQIKVVRVGSENFNATDFEVTYGDAAELGSYYRFMYRGWLNDTEGSDFAASGSAIPTGSVRENNLTCTVVGYDSIGDPNGTTVYTAWECIAGDVYKITPNTAGYTFTNYYVTPLTVEMKVVPRMITSATAASREYTEVESDQYNGGAFGAELSAIVNFANAGTGIYAPDCKEYVYSGKRHHGTTPNVADEYSVTVEFNTNANGTYNYHFASTVSGRVNSTKAVIDYEITKKVVTLLCANENNAFQLSGDKTNALANFVVDIMQNPSFLYVDENGVSSGVTFDYADGLPFTPDHAGTYYVVVDFKDAAALNYTWSNGQIQGAVQFVVASDGIITIGGFTLEGWHFGESMSSPEITVLPNGVQSTVSYTYATVADREGLTAGSVTATEVSEKYNVHTFTANPVNAGWYIVRAQAVGATNSAVAYYLFRIEKAEVEAPVLTVNAQNSKYSGAVLTVSVTYATTAFMSSDTIWSGSNGSATMSTTNQGSYHATFSLVNSANYTWKAGIRTGNLVSIDGVTRLSLAVEGDTLVYTWTVIPATDNTVSWSYGVVNGENVGLENGLAITYGDEFILNTSSRYLSATISLEYAPRGENDTQAPATGWSTNKAYLGGNYWVRVRSRSSNGNFNDAQATLKLTINKKALNIRVTGSLVYGQAFDEGGFAYEIVESLTPAEMSRITGTPVAYTLSAGSLDRNKLTVRTYALTLGSKTENGIAVVDGLSSNDFYFPVANVSGTLTVGKASILVQIGNAASYYSEATDYASAIEGLQLIGGSLADWESDTDLNELLKPTVVSDVNETSNVGNYAIRCTAYDNANYDVTFYNGIYRVEQLRIRIEISSGGGTYGDEVIEGASVTGIFKESDDAPITDAELRFSYIYTGVSNDGTWRYENGLSTSECPILAGTYTATAVNPENENYLLVGTSSVPFVVAKMSIDADAITVPNQAYTGNALSPSIIDDVYNVDGQEIYRVRPVSNCVNAGTYRITLVMNDFANMKWLGSDVEERTIPFVIEKATNSLTSAIEIEGWTYGSYDANANAPHATARFGTPVFYYASSIDGEYTTGAPRGENAGEYFVRAYIPGTDNYLEFALTDGNAVSFRISPVCVALPTLNIIGEGEGKNDTYAATDLSASISGFNATLMSINYDGRIAIAGNDVEVFARNAGTHTVTISFNDSVNYVWAWDGDAAVTNGDVVTLDWTIVKKQIAIPTANESLFIVNGGVLVYIPEGFDAEIMDISGNEQGYGGEFPVVVTLKDLENYEWIGGTNGAVEFTWKIVGVNTVFAVIVGLLSGGCALAVVAAVTQGVLLRKRRLADEQGPKDDTAEPDQQDAQSINEPEEEEKFND